MTDTVTDNPDQVLEAVEGFVCEIEGVRYFVQPGTTRVSASHILARTHPTHFKPVDQDLTYADDATTSKDLGREGRARTRQKTQPEPVRTMPATKE